MFVFLETQNKLMSIQGIYAKLVHCSNRNDEDKNPLVVLIICSQFLNL